ncbi:MAG: PRK06851 family protein [Heliobacteriaceae bacterium]|nr:PRK06851 family protein [Heliobacteriaceae bacterium]MDD4587509.1 PRK06851 family protein [Heliobacteriaceae bacterium]
MKRGRLRKMFAGANTAQGFFSFYDQIIRPDCTRIYVIKGGPGVGKSSLMKAIGVVLQEKGFDLEHHCCSSDNSSIDGLVIPAIGVALLDGTHPHVVEPKFPGAVGEIVYLGDYWRDDQLQVVKNDILQANHRVGRFFWIAYNNLKEAKVAHDEWEAYLAECMDWGGVNRVAAELLAAIFEGAKPEWGPARIRHLFANAVTPQGLVNHVPTLLTGYKRLFLVTGLPGTGKSTVLETVARKAGTTGLGTEVFHCTLDPQKVDLVLIPAMETVVMAGSELLPVDLTTLNLQVVTINLNEFINYGILNQHAAEVAAATHRFWHIFNRAAGFIRRAKGIHDELEKHYRPAMDFSRVNARKEQILQRILEYAHDQ